MPGHTRSLIICCLLGIIFGIVALPIIAPAYAGAITVMPTATAVPIDNAPPQPPTQAPTATPRTRPTPAPTPPPSAVITPVADAFVRGGAFATANYGADPTLVVKDGSAGYDRRAFLRFDLRDVASSSVRRAVLKLYVKDLPNGAPAAFRIAAVADDQWSEAMIAWNTQPALGASGMLYQITAPGWLTIHLTGYVNTQLATDKVISLALFDDTAGARMIRWSSREGAHPPVLEITP